MRKARRRVTKKRQVKALLKGQTRLDSWFLKPAQNQKPGQLDVPASDEQLPKPQRAIAIANLMLLLKTQTIRPELLEWLRARELMRLAGLCKFAYAKISGDKYMMAFANPLKLNPAQDWPHFCHLTKLHEALARVMEGKLPPRVSLRPSTSRWLQRAPALDWAVIKVAEWKSKPTHLWLRWARTETRRTGDHYVYWVTGQVNQLGKPHGFARIVTAGGEGVHEGQFVQGKAEGYGRYIWRGGYYVGEWRDGKQHGRGILGDSHGTFDCMWENGRKAPGQCTWTNASGAVYTGNFRLDKRPPYLGGRTL
jgi:hypothetical protein